MDPTTEFNLITFQDVRSASYSPTRIHRGRLRNRILFARTNRGNYAKFQVRSGDDLDISRLVVYNSEGCILRVAFNLRIRASFSCDLDNARESSTGADFWWHGVSRGVHYLESRNRAVFHVVRGFDEAGFTEIRAARFRRRRVKRTALRDQVIYCRTSRGRYAKLLVQAGDTLMVRRLVVYDGRGREALNRSNIEVPRSWTLDVDTGAVGARGYDLWWQARTSTSFYLVPANGASISYESAFRYERYQSRLQRPAIRSALVFEDASGARSYSRWSDAEKLQLQEFLYLRELGEPLPIHGPPALSSDRYMDVCDARKIYLAHVAQSLWVDVRGRARWRLSSASGEHLEHLFDSRRLLAFSAASGHYFSHSVMGNVTHWNPEISFRFLVDEGILGRSHESTLDALTEWIRAHLIHITGYRYDTDGGPFESQADQYEYIYGYRGAPLVDKIIHPLPGRRRITAGCWGTDGFFAAVLRSVNIPVRHGRSNFSGAIHSRPEFFTMNRLLAHGDDPYNGWVRLGHNNVPIDRLFYTAAEIDSEIDRPARLPGMTVAETASHNKSQRMVALAVEFKTRYLLDRVCRDMASGSTGPGSRLWNDIHEFYSDAQVETIRSDCQAAIAAIPGGCSGI